MNVLKPHLRITVQTLLGNGASQREIERMTGVDRKTIRRIGRGIVGRSTGWILSFPTPHRSALLDGAAVRRRMRRMIRPRLACETRVSVSEVIHEMEPIY